MPSILLKIEAFWMLCVTLETTWWGQRVQSRWPLPWENFRTMPFAWELSLCIFWCPECPIGSWGHHRRSWHSAGLSWTLCSFTGEYAESQLRHKMQISGLRMMNGFQIVSIKLYIIFINTKCINGVIVLEVDYFRLDWGEMSLKVRALMSLKDKWAFLKPPFILKRRQVTSRRWCDLLSAY